MSRADKYLTAVTVPTFDKTLIIHLTSGLTSTVAGNSSDMRSALSPGLLGWPASMNAKAPVTRLVAKLA